MYTKALFLSTPGRGEGAEVETLLTRLFEFLIDEEAYKELLSAVPVLKSIQVTEEGKPKLPPPPEIRLRDISDIDTRPYKARDRLEDGLMGLS